MSDIVSSKNLTIHDIAADLGVSASTVSRALSGKGRIGQATRDKILDYIKEHDYTPNAMAQSLAKSRTYNIALVMPLSDELEDMPFFQNCMYGVFDSVNEKGYDLIVITCNGTDTVALDRLIRNRKVDGIILSRTYVDDPITTYLKKENINFVTIGRVDDPSISQIDHDHNGACYELTSELIKSGCKKIAFLGSNTTQKVNICRFEGYEKALYDNNISLDKNIAQTSLSTKSEIEKSVENIMKSSVDCILCQDDYVCSIVINKLTAMGINIPSDVKIASCYDSRLIDTYNIPFTTLKFDTRKLGEIAASTLISSIEEDTTPTTNLLGYTLVKKY